MVVMADEMSEDSRASFREWRPITKQRHGPTREASEALHQRMKEGGGPRTAGAALKPLLAMLAGKVVLRNEETKAI